MTLFDLVLELNMLLAVLGAVLVMLRNETVPGRRSYAAMALPARPGVPAS